MEAKLKVEAENREPVLKPVYEEGEIPYEVQVLTVANMTDGNTVTSAFIEEHEDAVLSTASGLDAKGVAGHVLLTYPPIADQPPMEDEDDEPIRGRILASCGHWLELMKVDANIDRLLVTARREWGINSPQYKNMSEDVYSSTGKERGKKVQGYSNMLIQSRAPHSYNRRLVKAKYSGK
mmetsp:Transcript_13845/g.15780  ORF Transcript_13845/g.15780 Transcript_13845/m.15780 type:complete len:179 (+) Transcript_13845:234-770(+)